MKKIRLILSILLCKLLIFSGKLLGKRSSSAPGRFALKLCPDAIRLLSKQVRYEIICVLGTNGKTTTNTMIDTLITKKGFRTVCNRVGANMTDGVATAFLSAASLTGRLKADYAVLEIDEASAKLVFDHLSPNVIVITNLFRDQLDRYGEIEQTLHQLKLAIDKAPRALLILNADDPMTASFTQSVSNPSVTYGISEAVEHPMKETPEGRTCLFCGQPLDYEYYHYNQLGNYSCPSCSFQRPKPNYSATRISVDSGLQFCLNETQTVSVPMSGFYNIYNILAAICTAELLELDIPDYTQAFQAYETQTARMEAFALEKPVILNLAKNPAGFNQAISTLLSDPRKKAVVFGINDMPSDGIDISWLYDVNFSQLTSCVAYGASGKRRHDLALCLYYADVCEQPETDEDPVSLALKFLKTDCEVVYVLVNYTLIFDAKDRLAKEVKALEKSRRKGEKS